MCGISVERLAPGGPGLRVLLYNPLAWPRLTPVRVPLGADGAVAVIDAAGEPVVSQVRAIHKQLVSGYLLLPTHVTPTVSLKSGLSMQAVRRTFQSHL